MEKLYKIEVVTSEKHFIPMHFYREIVAENEKAAIAKCYEVENIDGSNRITKPIRILDAKDVYFIVRGRNANGMWGSCICKTRSGAEKMAYKILQRTKRELWQRDDIVKYYSDGYVHGGWNVTWRSGRNEVAMVELQVEEYCDD